MWEVALIYGLVHRSILALIALKFSLISRIRGVSHCFATCVPNPEWENCFVVRSEAKNGNGLTRENAGGDDHVAYPPHR